LWVVAEQGHLDGCGRIAWEVLIRQVIVEHSWDYIHLSCKPLSVPFFAEVFAGRPNTFLEA
jgi:hypothetical protein